MDRLTTIRDSVTGNRGYSSYATTFENPEQEVKNKLAAYEDTGLTPEEVTNLKTGSFSRLSEKCQKCPDRDECQNKRMEACAYLIPEPVTVDQVITINVSSSETAADIAEEIGKQLARKVAQQRGCFYG